VEVMWGEKAWAENTIAANVTTHCLDYGANQSNRVINRGGHLEITCYRPNIRPKSESIRYWNDNGNVTISVRVENDALVEAQNFNMSFDGTNSPIGGLARYGEVEVNHTIAGFPTGGYTVVIEADIHGQVDESIESDNTVNRTITI